MNKGFTLIETMLYVTLLSFIMMGVFSSLFIYLNSAINQPLFSKDDYSLLIESYYEKQ
jgi:type II secretory pathway pseudopilin PulG